jgi:hypothetical protein
VGASVCQAEQAIAQPFPAGLQFDWLEIGKPDPIHRLEKPIVPLADRLYLVEKSVWHLDITDNGVEFVAPDVGSNCRAVD